MSGVLTECLSARAFASRSLLGALVTLVVGCAKQPTIPSASASLGSPATTPPAETASTAPELSCRPDAAPRRPDEGQVLVFFTCGTSPVATVARSGTPHRRGHCGGSAVFGYRRMLAGPTPPEEKSGLRSWFSAATEGHLKRCNQCGHGLC